MSELLQRLKEELKDKETDLKHYVHHCEVLERIVEDYRSTIARLENGSEKS